MSRGWRPGLSGFLALLVILWGCDGLNVSGLGDFVENGNDNSPQTPDESGGPGSDGLVITGRIVSGGPAGARPAAQAVAARYVVAAQSADSQEIYYAGTDQQGNFEIDIPDSEQGSEFIITLLNDDGQPAGPIVFHQDGDQGLIGLDVDRAVALGDVELPGDPAGAPILPGAAFDGDDLVSPDLSARLNEAGVPVGVPSVGKGADAQTDDVDDGSIDRDHDGLPDFVDADNDGDGIADDFDTDGGEDAAATPEGVHLNFFMNLKISEERADTYYNGSDEQRAEALAHDTVITFEVIETSPSGPAISSVHVIDSPAPPYLPDMTVLGSGELWSASDYAFDNAERFQAFIVPNALINAGDTFVVQIAFDDGTTAQYWSMINYVFTNIPELVRYGAPGSLTAYTAGNGIQFDGSQDLVLEFRPPVDETGAYLTGFTYFFEIFYNDPGGAQQQGINGNATWPSPPEGFDADRQVYEVSPEALGDLSADNTYTVTLPKEIFVGTLTLDDGSVVDVGSYKIDIAAQNNGNNAALMVTATKQ